MKTLSAEAEAKEKVLETMEINKQKKDNPRGKVERSNDIFSHYWTNGLKADLPSIV